MTRSRSARELRVKIVSSKTQKQGACYTSFSKPTTYLISMPMRPAQLSNPIRDILPGLFPFSCKSRKVSLNWVRVVLDHFLTSFNNKKSETLPKIHSTENKLVQLGYSNVTMIQVSNFCSVWASFLSKIEDQKEIILNWRSNH